jgi:hypothetical protein
MEFQRVASRSAAYNWLIRFLHNNSDRPNIHLVGVPFPLQDFRRNIVGSPANGLLLFLVELQAGCQSEVSELDLHVLVEEEVSQFQAELGDCYSRWMTLFWCRYIKEEMIWER